MFALDTLSLRNGLKTTQGVLQGQQSGTDAYLKASPEQINMHTAKQMMQGNTPSVPSNEHEKAIERNAQTADGLLNGDVPMSAPPQQTQPKESRQSQQLSYADMYKMMNPNEYDETPEQKKRREKKEKNRKIISAVGDGLRALSDMYFASKGAYVNHDANQDMTKNLSDREKLLREQREKNRSAWLSGYQKAIALDEQREKNNAELAEQIRYHNLVADKNKRTGDQTDRKLDQSQQKIDLATLKYNTDADYKNSVLKIKEALKNGQIEHWQAVDYLNKLKENRLSSKASASSNGKNGNVGAWYEYYDMMDTDEGRETIRKVAKRMGIKSVTQTNIRYLMDKVKGRNSANTQHATNTIKPKPIKNTNNSAKSKFSIHKK